MERAETTFIIGGAVIGVAILYLGLRKAQTVQDGDPETTPDTEPLYTLGQYGYLDGITDSFSRAAEAVVTTVKSGVRGIRNNNPGNIELTRDRWLGLSPVQTDGRFAQFVEMRFGIRALAITLRNYKRLHGAGTVGEIITRWAPNTENNTSAYIAAVSDAVGVNPNDELDLSDPTTMFPLIRAIIAHENGRVAALLISDSTVRDGIQAAS